MIMNLQIFGTVFSQSICYQLCKYVCFRLAFPKCFLMWHYIFTLISLSENTRWGTYLAQDFCLPPILAYLIYSEFYFWFKQWPCDVMLKMFTEPGKAFTKVFFVKKGNAVRRSSWMCKVCGMTLIYTALLYFHKKLFPWFEALTSWSPGSSFTFAPWFLFIKV